MTRAAARHFAAVAASYDALRERWPLGALRAAEQAAVRAAIAVRPGDRVLEVGCGDGTTLAWLRACGARAVGIDLVWTMARHAARHGAPVVVQDFEELGVRPVFDWVLCIGALEFAADPDRALAGLAAALRAGGDPHLGLLFPRRGALGGLYAAYHRTHGVRIRLFSPAAIEAMLARAGLVLAAPPRHCALSSVCVARRAEPGASA